MEDKIEMLMLLAKHEFAVSRLYRKYAEKLPEKRDFWMQLSDEETDHGNCILEMKSRVEDGSVTFHDERFQITEIERSLAFIEEMMQDADGPGFRMKHALSAAHFLEESMIENKHFEVFEGDSPALIQVLKLLADATDEHRQRVLKELRKHPE
jgi:hypothetical protein